MDQRHTITLNVENTTWKAFRTICAADHRTPGQELAIFLQVMGGQSEPAQINPPALGLRLKRAFSLAIPPEPQKPEPQKQNEISFPTGPARDAVLARCRERDHDHRYH